MEGKFDKHLIYFTLNLQNSFTFIRELRISKMIHRSHLEVLHVHCRSVLRKNPTFLARILLKRPLMRYFRLPHGVSIHPHQRNKITVAQCQNWERNKQRALGRIQHLICGHRHRLENRQDHLQVLDRRMELLLQLMVVLGWIAGILHHHSQHGFCLRI